MVCNVIDKAAGTSSMGSTVLCVVAERFCGGGGFLHAATSLPYLSKCRVRGGSCVVAWRMSI